MKRTKNCVLSRCEISCTKLIESRITAFSKRNATRCTILNSVLKVISACNLYDAASCWLLTADMNETLPYFTIITDCQVIVRLSDRCSLFSVGALAKYLSQIHFVLTKVYTLLLLKIFDNWTTKMWPTIELTIESLWTENEHLNSNEWTLIKLSTQQLSK